MQLTRLKLNHFRGVKPGTELHFGSRFNVLLGVNATGKTTLLELIAAILADDLSAYAREPFDVEFELEIGGDQTTWKVNWDPMLPSAEVTLPAGVLQVTGLSVNLDSGSVALDTWASHRHFRARLFLKLSLPQPVEGDLMVLNLAAPSHPLDEGLDNFRALVSESPWGVGWASKLPLASQLVFHELLVAEPFAHWKASVGMNRPPIDWAWLAARQMGFTDAVFSVQKRDTQIQINGLVFVDSDGHYTDYSELSYGQKRLLAFYAHLSKVNGPVVIDELTNGLHHKWIDVCVQKLSDRQSFLSSQAPLLLDKLPWDSVKDVEKMFIRCERNGREFVWRNLTPAEAEELHLSKEQGIESTSEILAREGLW